MLIKCKTCYNVKIPIKYSQYIKEKQSKFEGGVFLIMDREEKVTENESLLKKDKNLVWHSMFRYGNGKDPMLIKKAEGTTVTDIYDNKYIDGVSGLWCVNVGYGREEIAKKAYEQMVEMTYAPLSDAHIPAVKLSEKLEEWLLGEYMFFYSNSGSEANETAFKIARQYQYQKGEKGRYKFISRYRAYHGNTFAALSATGQSHRKYRYEPLVPGFLHVFPPDCYRCPFNKSKDSCSLECVESINYTIKGEDKNTIAGVIMEPVITGGGILVTRDDYFKEVEKVCRYNEVLFIVDEVICGFGRTGESFGFKNYGVEPDIITMAKGITSGYQPLAVTAVKKEIFEKFTGKGEYEHLRHVNTYGGHPAACAAGIKNLEIIQEENLVESTREKSKLMERKLKDLYSSQYVGDIRVKGLMAGIELVKDKDSKEPIEAEKINQVISECKRGGLIIKKNADTIAEYNNILTLTPPLIISEKEINFITELLQDVIKGI